MTPQGGLDALLTPPALRAPKYGVFDIAPEGLSDVEVVHIRLAEYIVYSLQEVRGNLGVLWCIFLPHFNTLLETDA